jgi:hypothetical protein
MALFKRHEERRDDPVRYRMQEKIFSIGDDYCAVTACLERMSHE